MTPTLRLRSPTRITEDFLGRLRRRIPIARAYVFGSTARRERGATSDIDLIVVSSVFEGMPGSERIALLSKDWRYRLMPDLYALTPREFRARSRDSLIFRDLLKTAHRVR